MSVPRPTVVVRRALAVVTASALAVLGAVIPTLPAEAAYAKPSGLTAVSTATTSVRLTWTAVKKAPAYRIKYDDNSAMKSPAYAKTTTAATEITGLKPGKTYWFKVRVMSAKGTFLSSYGKTLKVKTRSAGDFALLSPAGLAATKITDTSIGLRWAKRGVTDRYRIRWATSTKLSDEAFLRVTGTAATLTDLSPGITYYISVRAITADGRNLSQYSKMIAVKTTGRASFKPPATLTAKASGAGSVSLAWAPVPGAPKYRIKYATQPWTDAAYEATTSPGHQLNGLQPNTTYYFKVRVLNADGSFGSDYSAAVQAKTPLAAGPLRVASYNIRAHNSSPESPYEQPWRVRRGYVASTILRANADVVALQEAQQSKLKDDSSVSQFEDLRNVLNTKTAGAPWKVTNDNRYNCSNPDSSKCEASDATPAEKAKAKNQGASNGTRIVYRTDRLTLLSQGSAELPKLHPAANPATGVKESYSRYVVWAFLQQKSTGRSFLFADIHLEPGNDGEASACGTAANPLCTLNRQTQARAVLAKLAAINTGKLPIVLAGDASSSRAEVGGNLPYQTFTSGGLVDPLGSTSYRAPATAPAASRINIAFNSVNKFEVKARRYAPGETTYDPANNSRYNGAYNDYFFVDKRVRITEFEQLVEVDRNGRFAGVIPSDHNLIRATLWLP